MQGSSLLGAVDKGSWLFECYASMGKGLGPGIVCTEENFGEVSLCLYFSPKGKKN